MNKTEFVEKCLDDIQPYDMTKVLEIFEGYKSELFHKQNKWTGVYSDALFVCDLYEVPEYVVEVIHQLLKDIMGDLDDIVKLPKGKYLRGILEFYRCLNTLEIKIINKDNPDFDTFKVIMETN